jgi:hypothetical protein
MKKSKQTNHENCKHTVGDIGWSDGSLEPFKIETGKNGLEKLTMANSHKVCRKFTPL